MGIASRSARRTASVDSAACDGNARVRRSEDSRGTPKAEAELLSREPPLQQLVVHVPSGAPPGMGVPGALGEQAHRHRRPGGSGPRANESTERARFTDVARLSVAHTAHGALKLHQRRWNASLPHRSQTTLNKAARSWARKSELIKLIGIAHGNCRQTHR